MDKNRVPVIVGAAQATHREKTLTQLDPLGMMAEASRMAGRDAGLSGLPRVDTLYVVNCLSRGLSSPARDLASSLAIEPAETGYTLIGATAPQWFVNRAAERICRGTSEVVIVCGAEAFHNQETSLAVGQGMEIYFTEDEATLARRFAGDVRKPVTELELRYGLVLPVTMYALCENASRAHWGLSLDEHRSELASFCAGLSEIASRNPYAWFREPRSASEIAVVSAENRMIVFPYTKWMCSIMDVNQAAAILMTSLGKAEALGIPKDRVVFVRGVGDAEDAFYVTERPELWASPSVAEAVQQALGPVPVSLDEIEHLDFYSCFPAPPRIAREMLGIAPGDPRPLSVTGGMPYFGGPGNNYALHAISQMVNLLRENPKSLGLVQALSWYISKHSVGLYGAEPGERPWTPRNPAEKARPYPRVTVAERAEGGARIESYALTYGRDGKPRSAVAVCRDAAGNRCLALIASGEGMLEAMAREEPIGRAGTVSWDRSELRNRFHFS